jgi:hypothetical protein
MRSPSVRELPCQLEGITPDPFIESLASTPAQDDTLGRNALTAPLIDPGDSSAGELARWRSRRVASRPPFRCSLRSGISGLGSGRIAAMTHGRLMRSGGSLKSSASPFRRRDPLRLSRPVENAPFCAG